MYMLNVMGNKKKPNKQQFIIRSTPRLFWSSSPSVTDVNKAKKIINKMASSEPQPRFGQSVKGLLSDRVGSCSGDVIALTRQVLKGSRSQEVKKDKKVDVAAFSLAVD